MSAELLRLTAAALRDRVAAGDAAALHATDASFDRGATVGAGRDALNIVLWHDHEWARACAEAVDAAVARGTGVGALAGVPVAIKDNLATEHLATTCGSRILEGYVSPYEATAVRRLRDAGAIVVGKTNMDEFAMGSSTEHSAYGPTRNPVAPDRVPGGSSGGSAAAVAAGLVPIALGSETGGSVRQPAAFCGITGIKPTYGRVSRYGLVAFASSLDHVGVFGRTVDDAALALQAIAGPDSHDSTAAAVPVPDYLAKIEEGVKGLRIGLSPDYFRITFPDPQTGEYQEQEMPTGIKAAVLKAADVLASLGAEIVEDVPMPNTRYGIPAYFVISRVEAASNLHRYDGVKYGYRTPGQATDLTQLYRRSRNEGFGLQPKLRILMGMYVSAAQYSAQYYQRALRVRTLIRRDFEQAFDKSGKYRADALLTPTTPTTAFKMGAVYGDSVLMQYADQLTVPANHAGIPGLSLPGGLDSERLPVGIQLLGPDYSEDVLLRIGRSYELATASEDWRKVKPLVLR